MEGQWNESVLIFLHNLSPFYVLSVGISLFAILFSVWYSRQCQKQLLSKHLLESEVKQHIAVMDECDEDPPIVDLDEAFLSSNPPEALQSRIKVARHQAIVNQLSSKMTQEQLEEEKETEKAQLTAILNLLKEQQEKFQVSDMDELEQQLSLYR